MKATEQFFPIMLYKVGITFESVDEILKCGHLNESNYFQLKKSNYFPTWNLDVLWS